MSPRHSTSHKTGHFRTATSSSSSPSPLQPRSTADIAGNRKKQADFSQIFRKLVRVISKTNFCEFGSKRHMS
ncbi:hypothetical protein L3X38_033320 [Prunus dulcis]|uniref:Uncharacterized protein n=1 Tax=Prunus dulcis TaxID=3755 RepID=A0AAD4YVS9_PRUDU|nr:hypothetical protein L3X38_033320 [Prunus dulcis]